MNRLLVRAKNLVYSMERSFWELGEVLCNIKEESLYREIGYSTFKDYCKNELNFKSIRTPQQAINMYYWKIQLGSDEAIRWVESIPWSYVKVFKDFANHDTWKTWRDSYSDFFKRHGSGRRFYVLMESYKKERLKNKDIEEPIEWLKKMDVKCLGKKSIEIEPYQKKTVYCEIPIDVYNRIVEIASDCNISISEEISESLITLYRGEDLLEKAS